jgi:hypothetical protein
MAKWQLPKLLLDLALHARTRTARLYRKYAPGDAALEEFENEAREGKKYLWVDP